MPKLFQIHGMLLEEALLYLLRFSGYRPVAAVNNDPTLRRGAAGLEVMGRGEDHQIDAIADFTVPQPFTNPARLLIEAKFKDKRVGIEIVRNAVGVLKDVCEYWVRGHQATQQPRYHYQYAILASKGFTPNAQRYAVAHDIYLIPFEGATFFRPVLTSIERVGQADGEQTRRRGIDLGIELSELRDRVRSALAMGQPLGTDGITNPEIVASMGPVLAAIRRVRFSILAVAINRIPLVLTPAENVDIEALHGDIPVEIYWDEVGWYLRRPQHDHQGPKLFSFDVPGDVLRQYIRQHEGAPELVEDAMIEGPYTGLTGRRALDLKGEVLSDIGALVVSEAGETRLLRFRLDLDWLAQVKRHLDERAGDRAGRRQQ